MEAKITNGAFSVEYDLSTGTFDLRDEKGGALIFGNAGAAARIARGGRVLSTRGAMSRLHSDFGGALVISHNYRDFPISMELHITPIENAAGFSFRLSVENHGKTDLRNVDFSPLVLEHIEGSTLFGAGGGHDYRFLRNGFLTWSGSGVHGADDYLKRPIHRLIHDACANPEVPIPRARGHFISEWFGAVRDNSSGGVIIVGFTTTRDQLAQIDFKSRGGHLYHLKAVSHGENNLLAAGGSLASEELAVIIGEAPRKSDESGSGRTARVYETFDAPLKTYARLALADDPPPKSKTFNSSPVGWCSWYYYYDRMTERVILENLDVAESLADRLPIGVFQVDDGYEPAPGDWLGANEKFPHGLEWLAQKIRVAGFTPGLWYAPFFATNRSELFRKHRDWFVRREDGRPRWVSIWPNPSTFGSIYALDTTHPEVLEWLGRITKKIVCDWGYEYIKLDFLYNGAIDGLRHDPRATRAQAFRRGLETIREAAGPDTYILGCGIPLALGNGIVNGSRVSGDTAPYWRSALMNAALGHPGAPGVYDTAHSLFRRWFMHGIWGLSDPDCLMCRFKDTKLSADEVLTHAAIVALMGGPLFISDDLSKLDSRSIRLAQQLIPPLEESAVPIDLFESSPPATLMKKFERGFDPVTIVGRFNWLQHTTELSLDFAEIGLDPETEYHVFEIWEEKYHGIHRGKTTLSRVPGHASRILSIRPVAGVPQLVATTFHFTQGGIDLAAQDFNSEKKRLTLRLAAPCKRRGAIYIHIPAGLTPKSCVIDGTCEEALRNITGRLFRVELDMEDCAEILIQF
jgi:alpha-galactosidase